MTTDAKFITQDYFEIMLSRGVTDFTGLYLNGLQAMGCDFSDAIFRQTNLNGVDFRQSKFGMNRRAFTDCFMMDVIFRKCNLSFLKFSGNDMRRGQFQDVMLFGSHFKDCDFNDSVFDGADIRECSFKDCDLSKSDFSKAFSLEKTKFLGCNTENTNFGQHKDFFIEPTKETNHD